MPLLEGNRIVVRPAGLQGQLEVLAIHSDRPGLVHRHIVRGKDRLGVAAAGRFQLMQIVEYPGDIAAI